ncbi:MAG: hypothetical protein IJ464_06700 [Alistipes sp.]|nr:hypothetical protein [Alistipes sp.]
MKRFNILMMLVAMMAITVASCTKENGETPDTPTPPSNSLTFDVKVGEVGNSSIAYTVTPSDLEATYIIALYDVETANEFTRDTYLIAALLQELETEANSTGYTLAEYMPDFVDKGLVEGSFEQLAPGSDYYIIVFGVNPEDNYRATTELTKVKVSTPELELIDIEFDVKTSVVNNTAEFTVTPSDPERIWYFYTLPKASFEAYTDPEGNYRMSQMQFLLYCLQMQIEGLRGAGYSDNQILNNLFHKGTLTLKGSDLIANTDYATLVAAFDVTEEGSISIISDVSTSTYKTENVEQKDFTFEIKVSEVESNRAAIKVTPTNQKETFCWLCAAYDGVSTAEEVMADVVKEYGSWMNSGMMLYSGTQDYTGGIGSQFKYKLSAADTEHFVIAFGYAGGVTTPPVMTTFKTLPGPDPATTEFSMKATGLSPYGFTVKVTASHEYTYYNMNICTPEEYDEEAFIKESNEGFDYMLEQAKNYDPNTTVAMILDQYYLSGSFDTVASGVLPETKVMGYIFALDPKTGHVVKAHRFDDLATTKSLGSVTPTVELVGYYHGDAENGEIFGNAAATKGKAITVVKYSGLDGARTLFTTSVVGDCSNPVGHSDTQVWADCVGYWKSCKLSQPYTFYVANWQEVLTALAYVVDNSGNIGSIGRLYTCPTAQEKSDISELKALVDELNASEEQSLMMPESLVISSTSQETATPKPMLAPVVKEEAKVEPVAVAEPAVEEDVRMVKALDYIRPFYIHR